MLKIRARSLLQFAPMQLEEVLTGQFIIVFDDGEEVVTTPRATIYSRYAWNLHVLFPNTPLLKAHHLNSLYPNTKDNLKLVRADALKKLLAEIVDIWFDTYPNHTADEKHMVYKCFEQSFNQFYNEMVIACEAYVNGNSLLDILSLINDPHIKEIRSNPDITPQGIVAQQKAILSYLENTDTPVLNNNPLIRSLRAGLAKSASLQQRIGPYGYPRDVDESIFPYPILRGYAQGMRSIYDTMTESRTSARALFMAGYALSTSEYFARTLTMNTSGIRYVDLYNVKDCGSTVTRPSMIRDEKVLRNHVGKYYVDNDGKEHEIKRSDRHLIGRIVKLRTPLGCMHKDPYTICAKCYGKLARNILPHTNLGYVATTALTQPASQSVMSAKHQVGSAQADPIVLDLGMKQYFTVMGPEKNQYGLNPRLKGKQIQIQLPKVSMENFSDVLNLDSLDGIEPSDITAIDKIDMMVKDDMELGKNSKNKFSMAYQNRTAYMTKDAIEYIIKNLWTLDRHGNYILNLSDWDFEKPFMEIPIRMMSSLDRMNKLEAFLAYSHPDKTGNQYVSELADMIWQNMEVNIANIEIIALAAMAVNKVDFSIPKPWTKSWVAGVDATMMQRSMSGALAFERHRTILTSGVSFINTNVPDHPFDYLFVPEQIAQYQREQAKANKAKQKA